MISVASGVEGTGATAIRQPNASRLTASGARSGGRLGGILQPLGLAFDPRQLAWAEAEKHEVAGNHVRFDAKSDLVLDEGWKKSSRRSGRAPSTSAPPYPGRPCPKPAPCA